MENIAEKPLFMLEEQLARQKGILGNSALIRKLPDKGAKLRDSVAKIEAEIEKRRKESAQKKTLNVSKNDVKAMEWILSSGTSITSSQTDSNKMDSDDDEDYDNEERVLEVVATSQISQRQPKPTINEACDKLEGVSLKDGETHDSSDDTKFQGSVHSNQGQTARGDSRKLDKYVARLVNVDSTKPLKDRYVPAKTLRNKSNGINPSESSSGSAKKEIATPKRCDVKYAECLLPPNHNVEPVSLPLNESIILSEEKYKMEEEMAVALTSAPSKKYAYDKLKEEGLLGTYNVEMQVSRPVRNDLGDEDDLEEDDLSDDHITEDSESEDEDNDTIDSNTLRTSKDLSNLLNTTLKLKTPKN